MEVETLIDAIQLATIVAMVAGTFASALMEMVKQTVRAITRFHWQVPPEWMTVLSGIISVVVTVQILVGAGTDIYVAVMAGVVAVFTPKVAHDLVRRQT